VSASASASHSHGAIHSLLATDPDDTLDPKIHDIDPALDAMVAKVVAQNKKLPWHQHAT